MAKGKFVVEISVTPTTRFYLTSELTWTRILDYAQRYTTFNKAERALESAIITPDIVKMLPEGKRVMPLIAVR